MGINIPNLPNYASSAIVREAEKQNKDLSKDHGKAERDAEAKRQRAARQNPSTSGKK